VGDEKKVEVLGSFNSRRLLEIRVKEIMNRRPRTVRPETSIDGLLERLLGQIEGCFPVVDRDQRLLGIVTESDVLQVLHPPVPKAMVGSVFREAMKVTAKTVGEIMTKRPITVTPEMTVVEALNLMSAHKLRRLPVVEGEKLVGLVSLRDIIDLYRVLR
jgi:acetoin utilization protein AcuB